MTTQQIINEVDEMDAPALQALLMHVTGMVRALAREEMAKPQREQRDTEIIEAANHLTHAVTCFAARKGD